MLEIQKHRGPGPASTWASGDLVLGHRRLAILDLSEAGRQPMHSRDGRWTIVFNGEIFNYRELRDELSGERPDRTGGFFKTATDTEVLLEACAAWGVERALTRVHGMFGFALWDGARRELTLARDHAGEKPLVYFWDGATLAFASELKALADFHGRRLDPSAVDSYLALGFVPAPLAIFAGCRKLPAGHLIRFCAEDRSGAGCLFPARDCASADPCPFSPGEPALRPRRWWFAEGTPARDRSRTNLMGELRFRVGEAVRLRLRSDVPIALSLSGGVDSSVIAAECVRQGARPEAFTVRFDDDETDLPYARLVAKRLGLEHHVLAASPAALAERLEDIAFHYDEPFADSSALACFALGEAVGGRFRVLLDGEGGDEAFGGYRHYEYIALKQGLKAAAAAAGWCDGAGGGRQGVYVHSKNVFRAEERRALLGPAAPEWNTAPGRRSGKRVWNFLPRPPAVPSWTKEALEDLVVPAPGTGALHRALHIDRELALASGLTYKMDIALAAFSLEGRAPLLDHAVLEWAHTLPPRELVRGRQKKVLLRAAYAGELPAEVLGRQKHGFGAPVERWLAGPLGRLACRSLPCPWFASSAQSGATGQRRWALWMFSLWARHWGATW